jgi:hypothetical protein
LARADVREAQRRRVSVLPELYAGRTAGGKCGRAISYRYLEFRRDAADARAARAGPGG